MKVTPFDQSATAPFDIGRVPRAGWFCIEPECEWLPKNQADLTAALDITPEENGEDHPYKAVLDSDSLQALADAFDLAETEGRGLTTTEDHSYFTTKASSKAVGWVKALHYDGGYLWAWIEWTKKGHEAMNEGEFVFFSTEYDYSSFRVIGDHLVEPTRLAGLSVTNFPNHSGQVPVTNSKQTTPMKEPTKRKTLPATKPSRDRNTTEKEDELVTVDANKEDKDDEQDLNTEDDTPPDTNDEAISALEDIAAALELESSATMDDVLGAITTLVTRNRELEEALVAANSGARSDNNSRRRYPHLLGGGRCDINTLKGDKPNSTKQVRVAGKVRDVNTQDKAFADYCRQAVDKEETKLGRKLTTGEYNSVWKRASADYTDGSDR